MSHNEQKKENKFFNGFFWGALLGGASAYVLSTKKGRQMVKELITQGADLLEEKAATKQKIVDEAVSMVPASEDFVEEEVVAVLPKEEKVDSKKRFFKKAVKK